MKMVPVLRREKIATETKTPQGGSRTSTCLVLVRVHEGGGVSFGNMFQSREQI